MSLPYDTMKKLYDLYRDKCYSLSTENARLKRLVAEQARHISAMQRELEEKESTGYSWLRTRAALAGVPAVIYMAALVRAVELDRELLHKLKLNIAETPQWLLDEHGYETYHDDNGQLRWRRIPGRGYRRTWRETTR